MSYSLGEVPLPFELDESYWKWVESLRKQDSTGKPDVPVLKYYEPEPLPIKPPTEDIPFISPGPSDNYILPKPSKPEPFLSGGILSNFISQLRPSPNTRISMKEITVTTSKKLRFYVVVEFRVPSKKVDESLLKDKFESELRSRARFWDITCTDFMIKSGAQKRGSFYYAIRADLVVIPRLPNFIILRFVLDGGDIFLHDYGPRLTVVTEEDMSARDTIVFADVMRKIFNAPNAYVYWERVYMDEIDGTLSPGVLVYSEVTPFIIHWDIPVVPQPHPITPQPLPISPPPVEIPVEPQPTTPVTETPIGGMVPVSEEKKDEKKDEKKSFPWWVVIVVVVVVLFFMMKK